MQKHWRTIIILSIFAVAIGVGGAVLFDLQSTNSGQKDAAQINIQEILLGIPNNAAENSSKNFSITQLRRYTTIDNLALRVVRDPMLELTLTVRLLDERQRISILNPEKISLAANQTGYCCWKITTPGVYTMQIIRPDSIVTNIPLDIREAKKQNSKLNI